MKNRNEKGVIHLRKHTLKQRLIAQFGEGFYRYIFKEEIDNICAEMMARRLSHKKYGRFYVKRISTETKDVLPKFREKTYYKALFLRMYKEHGERILKEYDNSEAYLDELRARREESYRRAAGI